MKRYPIIVGALAGFLAYGTDASADYIRNLKAEHVDVGVKLEAEDIDVKDDLTVADDLTVSGTITGAVTGNITGNVTGNVTGDVTGNVTGDVTGDVTGQVFGTTADEQIIAAGGTITADSCGGIKRISTDDQGAVTTDTTNTFTPPAAGNKGCIMHVCNSGGTDDITLDDNALFEGSGIAGGTPGNTVLGEGQCVTVGSDGVVWRQLGPGSQNN